jgi:hypothetical protein
MESGPDLPIPFPIHPPSFPSPLSLLSARFQPQPAAGVLVFDTKSQVRECCHFWW